MSPKSRTRPPSELTELRSGTAASLVGGGILVVGREGRAIQLLNHLTRKPESTILFPT